MDNHLFPGLAFFAGGMAMFPGGCMMIIVMARDLAHNQYVPEWRKRFPDNDPGCQYISGWKILGHTVLAFLGTVFVATAVGAIIAISIDILR